MNEISISLLYLYMDLRRKLGRNCTAYFFIYRSPFVDYAGAYSSLDAIMNATPVFSLWRKPGRILPPIEPPPTKSARPAKLAFQIFALYL